MRRAWTLLLAAVVTATGNAAEAATPSITAIRGTVKIKAGADHLSESMGLFRAGQTLRLRRSAPQGYAGCTRGWYAVEPRGFVCATPDTSFDADNPRALAARAVLPADRGYPFQYARVTTPSPRRWRLPEALESSEPLLAHFGTTAGPAKDDQSAYPGMKIAWARELLVADQAWVVTPDLHLIRKDHIEDAPSVLGRSAWLPPHQTFPFGIPLRDTPQLTTADALWSETSLVPLAAGPFRGGIELGFEAGRRAAQTAAGGWITRADISVFNRRARPPGVGANDKWIHVRINSGALIAYEGDEAVFAAVISPGLHGASPKGKYRTPTGRYRIHAKHLTADMGGESASGGSWRSRAVPWVAYFHEGYALHGAWWHDVFGRPRSHGCVNLTPGDAHKLFGWLDPQVPEGWYAVSASTQHPGTLVLISP